MVESPVLVFTDPGTFDLIPLAIQWGRGVAVHDDGPEAEALRELLMKLRPRGAYAIGRKESALFLKEYESPVWVADQKEAFRLLGLNRDDLPPVVREAIQFTQDYLDAAQLLIKA